ncbi:MAG: adenylyl-sulfate kinase [Anaeromyxobacter sp.]
MTAGAVVWVTGLPSAGKSTFARALHDRLRARGAPSLVLDGDEVRAALSPTPGYGEEAREAFYATLADLAALLAGQGLVVLVAATANRRAYRARARARALRFVEVFVDVPAEVCASRDPKGLWSAARAGHAPRLPGAGADYERPERADVVARGGEDAAALEAALALV